MLPADLSAYLARHFAGADLEEAQALLQGATLHDGTPPGARLLRCAAVASHGSLDRLRMEIATLQHDYRDVIVEGEYLPGRDGLKRVRDLNQPISDDT